MKLAALAAAIVVTSIACQPIYATEWTADTKCRAWTDLHAEGSNAPLQDIDEGAQAILHAYSSIVAMLGLPNMYLKAVNAAVGTSNVMIPVGQYCVAHPDMSIESAVEAFVARQVGLSR